jgi:hypothetical protein
MSAATQMLLFSYGATSVIGTPVSLGGAIGGVAASTIALTTLAAIPAGATVFVMSSFGKNTTVSVSSISDGTNTYQLAKSAGWNATNGDNDELWYAANCAAVSLGATLTVTLSSTTAAGHSPVMCAAYCTGLIAAPLDLTNSLKYEPGTAYSSGSSGTLTQAKEIIIGGLGFYNAACTITEGSGFTQIVDQDEGSGARFRAHLAYQIVNATTSINYQPTLSASNFGGSIIATFKGA